MFHKKSLQKEDERKWKINCTKPHRFCKNLKQGWRKLILFGGLNKSINQKMGTGRGSLRCKCFSYMAKLSIDLITERIWSLMFTKKMKRGSSGQLRMKKKRFYNKFTSFKYKAWVLQMEKLVRILRRSRFEGHKTGTVRESHKLTCM